jgi:antitoxin HigA-1
MHEPLHPGEVVRKVLIEGTGLTVTEAAEHLGVTRPTLSRLTNGKSGISPEMATRLSKLMRTSIDMWISLQAQYNIYLAKQCENEIIVPPLDDVA